MLGYYSTPLVVANDPLRFVSLVVVPGLLSLVALPLRHRLGWGALLLACALLVISPAALGSALGVAASLTRHRGPFWQGVTAAGLVVVAKLLQGLFIYRNWEQDVRFELLLTLAGAAIALALGAWARARDEAGVQRRAGAQARAEAEAHRVAEARLAERERLAREMHDVVAHRISLVAMMSGALAHRPGIDPELRDSIGIIQTTARQALDELRAVLADLRGADEPPAPPQPTLAELPTLLTDNREAGMQITLTGSVAEPPASLSRHAYRIVQEALTNARKHAPGAPVTVEISGLPGATLQLEVRNAVADLAPDRSGARLGLVGVQERAALCGGEASAQVEKGLFTLRASLPWPDVEQTSERMAR